MVDQYWLSCPFMTIWVMVHGSTIIDTAPIARRFIGQPFSNIIRWAKRTGEIRVERLSIKGAK